MNQEDKVKLADAIWQEFQEKKNAKAFLRWCLPIQQLPDETDGYNRNESIRNI